MINDQFSLISCFLLFEFIISSKTIFFARFQSVNIKEISDKFPEKSGGLKELYERGPQNAFYLVKCWADLNTNVTDESQAFYAVTSQYVFLHLITVKIN